MSPQLSGDRWQRLEELFAQAIELPAENRASFIDAQTAGDAELRRQLMDLVRHADSAGDHICDVIEGLAQSVTPPPIWVGRRFGPYRLIREVGRGGMGIVFEAIRDDDEYRKTVALKVAPWWRDVRSLIDTFRQERQILAELEHPNIARFLDGGTQDGVPYFAMEFVEGRPITEYCAAAKLNTADRIGLFRQVCDAVHHAHESLVVHRDLKPSNILVTNDGTPKLLDFGIAKLMSPLPSGHTTATTGMPWTPDYASPEQVRARPVTTRTDVYSLGLVLYELLTGERAQVADTSSPMALHHSVCDAEIAPGNLEGDLDRIVRKATAKEPERRYSSVAEFSDDLRRYLAHEPVRARPNTLGYRASKLIRRHRYAAAAAALVIVAIVGGIASTIHQARRAERRFNQVRALANAFVFDVHDRVATLPGATEARKVIVQTALKYLESLREDAAGDVTLARELSQAYEKIGDVQGLPASANLGDSAGALQSYTYGESVLKSAASTPDATSLQQLAWFRVKMAMVRSAQGQVKAALDDLQQARRVADQLLAKAPKDSNALNLGGELYSQLGRHLSAQGDPGGARDAAHRSMEIARQVVSLDPSSADARMNLSTAYTTLGTSQIVAGNLEDAATSFREAVRIREALVKEMPADVKALRGLMIAYGHLGDVLGQRSGENLGDLAGSEAAFEKARGIAVSLAQSDPADRKALFDISSAELRLGSVLTSAGKWPAALQHLTEAERLNDQLAVGDPKNNNYRFNGVYLHRRIAAVLEAKGKETEALQRLQKARTMAETQLAANPRDVQMKVQHVTVSLQAASMLSRSHAAGEAGPLVDAAAETLRKQPGLPKSRWLRAELLRDAGRVYARLGSREPAVELLQASLDLWKGITPPALLRERHVQETVAVARDVESARALGASKRDH